MQLKKLASTLAIHGHPQVWAEACLLAAPVDERAIAHVNIVLADVAETEAILAAYEEAVLENTRQGKRVRKRWSWYLWCRRRGR